MTEEERKKIVETVEYKWETCVRCGRSEKAYFLETGFAMLLWHVESGCLCEFCYDEVDSYNG